MKKAIYDPGSEKITIWGSQEPISKYRTVAFGPTEDRGVCARIQNGQSILRQIKTCLSDANTLSKKSLRFISAFKKSSQLPKIIQQKVRLLCRRAHNAKKSDQFLQIGRSFLRLSWLVISLL
ncbi:hypothetical protein ACN9ML_01095 [Dyadobacter endophyticus]|uniref:hypothetical protein n=1 Tax=Dyadobacter TaxID=120831 RepID=UPI00166C749B|nr:hypothetical protein [Dyadobacter endophyticus]